MKKLFIPLLITAGLLGSIFLFVQVVRGQAEAGSDTVINSENQGENLRQVSAPVGMNAPEQPNIGFIDSPSATCYQPDHTQDTCYLNWYYLNVSASPNYIISMTVAINSIGLVANTQGFFQTSAYIPYNMMGNGFKVACGSPGAGGAASMGNAYAYTIRARDSAALSSANYGTVYCPAYKP
jgi:hypothetical protein